MDPAVIVIAMNVGLEGARLYYGGRDYRIYVLNKWKEEPWRTATFTLITLAGFYFLMLNVSWLYWTIMFFSIIFLEKQVMLIKAARSQLKEFNRRKVEVSSD